MPLKSRIPIVGLAIVVFATTVGIYAVLDRGKTVAATDPSNTELVELGERIYREACVACHGVNLEGQLNWRVRNTDGTLPAPPHDKSGHTWHHPDQELFKYTKFGGAPIAPPGFKSAMPGFVNSLTDREIWAVLSFIKSHWPEREREHQTRITERSKN